MSDTTITFKFEDDDSSPPPRYDHVNPHTGLPANVGAGDPFALRSIPAGQAPMRPVPPGVSVPSELQALLVELHRLSSIPPSRSTADQLKTLISNLRKYQALRGLEDVVAGAMNNAARLYQKAMAAIPQPPPQIPVAPPPPPMPAPPAPSTPTGGAAAGGSFPLTPENAKHLADYQAGKITADQLDDRLNGRPAGSGGGVPPGGKPPAPPGAGDDPADFPWMDDEDRAFAARMKRPPRQHGKPPKPPQAAAMAERYVDWDMGRDSHPYDAHAGAGGKWDDALKGHPERQAAAAAKKAQGAANVAGGLIGGGGKGASGVAQMGLQAAGAGLLGEGAAAGAGGPVGLAIAAGAMAIDASVNKLAGGVRLAGDMSVALGNSLGKLARNDGSGLVQDWFATNAKVQDSLSSIFPAAKIASAGLEAMGKAVGAAKGTLDAFVARGRELSGYDGRLASASAQADVARLRADIREAQRTGDGMAELIERAAKLETTVQDTLGPLTAELAKGLAEVVDELVVLVETVKPGIEFLAQIMKAQREAREGVDKNTGLIDWLGGGVGGGLRRMFFSGKQQPPEQQPDLLADIRGIARGMMNRDGGNPTAQQGDVESSQRLGIPLLSGY